MQFEDSAVSVGLERQVKHIQFRIQQEISLADNEIHLYSQKLNGYKNLILQREETLNQLNNKILSAREMYNGNQNKIKINRSLEFAKIKSAHQAKMKEIRDEQVKEIRDVQTQFENLLKSFNHQNEEKIERKYKEVCTQVNQYKHTLNSYQTKLSEFSTKKDPLDAETTNHCTVLNNSLIIELRNIINERNNERIENLKLSKAKLNECITQLESMEKEHDSLLDEKRRKLSSMDRKHDNEVRKMTQIQEHKIRLLKAHLVEAERRSSLLSKAAHKLEQSNETQLHATMQEIDYLTATTIPQQHDTENVESEKRKVQNLTRLRESLRTKLEEKEAKLEEARSANNLFKKDISRIRHEIRFSTRRTQKGL